MDFYLLFKLLHVLAAVAWVGGGVALFAIGLYASGRRDDAEVLHVCGQLELLAPRWFVPTSVLTLLSGIVAATLGGLWGEAWVALGLAGSLITSLTGNFIMKPAAERIRDHTEAGRRDAALADSRGLFRVVWLDYGVLLAVIVGMVLKPGWTDIPTLALMALCVAAGAFLAFGQSGPRQATA